MTHAHVTQLLLKTCNHVNSQSNKKQKKHQPFPPAGDIFAFLLDGSSITSADMANCCFEAIGDSAERRFQPVRPYSATSNKRRCGRSDRGPIRIGASRTRTTADVDSAVNGSLPFESAGLNDSEVDCRRPADRRPIDVPAANRPQTHTIRGSKSELAPIQVDINSLGPLWTDQLAPDRSTTLNPSPIAGPSC